MSGGGNSGSGTTTQEIPQWLQDEYQQNIDRAEGVAGQGFTPYGGQLAAGDNQWLSAARDQAVGAGHAGLGEMNEASKVYGEIAGASPYLNSAQQLAGSDLSAYTNPYEDQVVKKSLKDLDLQRQRTLNESDASTERGAFGGSRQGVSDALTNEAYARTSAQTAAGLRQDGYTQAQGLASADVDRRTNNDQFNTGIDQQNTAFNLQGAQGLLGTAGQRQSQALNTASALGQLGQQYQTTQQGQLDGQYNEFLRQQEQPRADQALVSQAVLGINNAGGTTTTNSKGKGFSL